jgi:hypothetical protein
MRRLPAERMMDRLIAGRDAAAFAPAERDLTRPVAERLAAFHAQAATSRRIAVAGDRAIRRFWHENFTEWAPFIGRTISVQQDRALRAYGAAFFFREQDLLRRRMDEGRIRDCHGDLRSDSVCFLDTDHVCIFDRLEFNRLLRSTDVAGDVGFLAMDLEYRHRPDLARAFVDRYIEVSGDHDLRRVLDFYACYRACVRGKVESLRSIEAEVPARERQAAARAARRYFDLACRYARRLPPAFLIVMCGLAASGKSALARRLGEKWGMDVLSSDVLRKQLAGLGPGERRAERFGEGIYAAEMTDRTYQALCAAGRAALAAGRSVVLDASFLLRKQREAAQAVATATGAQFLLVECRSSDATAAARLASRQQEGRDPSDARWEIYQEQKRRAEPVSELPPERHLVVDTEQPLAAEVRAVDRAVRQLWPWGVGNRG